MVALFLVLVFGLSYIWVVLIQNDPLNPPYEVKVALPASGGLLERSNVTLRGTVVGRVKSIDLDEQGVVVTAQIKGDVELPAKTDVLVGALSVAGEQYLDFRPSTSTGPYLQDGDLVSADRVTVPVPFGELLSDIVRFADQVDPADVRRLGTALSAGLRGGEQDLRTLFANSQLLMDALEESEPATTALLDRSSTVLDLAADTRDDWRTIARSSRQLAGDLRAADPSLRALLRDGPETLRQLELLTRDLRSPLETGLEQGSLLTQILGLRVPAVGALLESLQRGAQGASRVVNSGSIDIGVDLDPSAQSCSYGTPTRSPTIGGKPRPFLYGYCTKTGPQLLQRGAAVAPRPPGDDTATAPPGATVWARAGDPI